MTGLAALVVGHPEHVHHALDAITAEDAHQVVVERQEEARGSRVTLAAGAAAELVVDAAALVPLGADDVQPAAIRHARAEHDVGAAAGHVGGDRHRARLTGIGDDQRLPLVLLGVEHLVPDAALFQQPGEALRLFNRDGADQDRAAAAGDFLDLLGDRVELRLLGLVDQVRTVVADHRLVGRDHDHLELVDLVELLRLGHGGTGHPRQLFVQAEVVLVSDGGQRLRLLLDLDAFFGFNRLVEPIGPAPAGLLPAREFVDDDYLAVLDQVITVALVEGESLEGLVDLVRLVDVLQLVDILDAGPALDLGDALLGEGRRLGLFVDRVVLRRQSRDQLGVLVILLGRLLRLAGNDQWGAGLVDQDAVDLVDDRVIQAPLYALREIDRHVVAQVVEPELAVGAVGDVGLVGLRPGHRAQVLQAWIRVGLVEVVGVVDERHLVTDDRHAHAERLVDRRVPARVAAGQVVVDRDQVRALALQGVQIERQHRDQRLALTGLHLGNRSLVQHDAADVLDVEVPQPDGAAGRLPDDGEGFDQQVVQGLALLEALAELRRLGLQLLGV